MHSKTNRRSVALTGIVALSALSVIASGCSAQPSGSEKVELSVLITSGSERDELTDEMFKAFEAEYPDITIATSFMPEGGEAGNIIKTKLATGDMEDVFGYFGGSLMQALKPDETLVDLSDQPWASELTDSFAQIVSTDKGLYSAPMGTSAGGVILYNKPLYAELGLEVPTNWAEFMENNQIILDSGKAAPVIQTFGETWTSQILLLADFGNAAAQDPDLAAQYTAGEVKNVDQPLFQGWLNQAEVFERGFLNEDYASTTYDDGMRMVATGEGAHYPMTSDVIGTLLQNYPDNVDDVGAFAVPAQNAEDTTLTLWPPGSWFIPKTAEGAQLDAAKKFLAFVNSPKGCELQNEYRVPGGAYVISSCTLPADSGPMLTDLQPYFDDNRTAAALEFVSPIKGPNLEYITVEVGSGTRSPEDGAALYDEDVKKQAQQLGLEGW